MVILTEKQKELIKIILEKNGFEYNLSKASEELQELSLILTQKLNKPTKVEDKDIYDEIGDVIIRLSILQKIYNLEEIQKRINFKLSKFQEYVDHKQYKKI